MRRRVPGMDELDHAILEFLHELGTSGDHPVTEPPRIVWYNLDVVRGIIDKDPSTVSRHMKSLAEDGLLEILDRDRGYYAITDLGIRYIDGELSEEEYDDLREARTK